MSQIDFIHFLPSLLWMICLFIGFYFFIIGVFIPIIYKSKRSRKFYLSKLSTFLKNEMYLIISLRGNMVVNKKKDCERYVYNFSLYLNKKFKILIRCIY